MRLVALRKDVRLADRLLPHDGEVVGGTEAARDAAPDLQDGLHDEGEKEHGEDGGDGAECEDCGGGWERDNVAGGFGLASLDGEGDGEKRDGVDDDGVAHADAGEL